MLLSAGTEDGEGEATHMKILGAIIPPGQDFFEVEKLWMLVCYPACALRALGLLLADGAPTVGGGKTF